MTSPRSRPVKRQMDEPVFREPTSPVGSMWAAQVVIYPGVELGDGARVDAFVVLGEPPVGDSPGAAPLRVGRNARIRSHTVIYGGSRIGDDFQTGHGVLMREATMIGDEVSIGSHSVVEHHVTIGDRVRIHSNAFIPEYSVLEEDPGSDRTWSSPTPATRSPDGESDLAGPHVRSGAKIGANATLLPGVVIGRTRSSAPDASSRATCPTMRSWPGTLLA